MINKDWKFWLEAKDGAFILRIPDRGGMTDMLPQDDEQQAWVRAKLEGIAGVKEIWPTDWKLDAAAEKAVRALLVTEGITLEL